MEIECQIKLVFFFLHLVSPSTKHTGSMYMHGFKFEFVLFGCIVTLHNIYHPKIPSFSQMALLQNDSAVCDIFGAYRKFVAHNEMYVKYYALTSLVDHISAFLLASTSVESGILTGLQS